MINEIPTLFHIGFSRSTTVLWMLEEVGCKYKVHPIDRDSDKRDPSYLKINPMGKVPALSYDGSVVTEAAAICLYLAETFEEANLNIDVGDQRRGDYLKWLFFAPSCLEPVILERMFKREKIPYGDAGWGDFDRVIEVVSSALSKGPFILGDRFTAADVVVGSQLGWGIMIEKIPETPEIKRYMSLLNGREARQRTFDMEEKKAWPQ